MIYIILALILLILFRKKENFNPEHRYAAVIKETSKNKSDFKRIIYDDKNITSYYSGFKKTDVESQLPEAIIPVKSMDNKVLYNRNLLPLVLEGLKETQKLLVDFENINKEIKSYLTPEFIKYTNDLKACLIKIDKDEKCGTIHQKKGDGDEKMKTIE